MSARRRTRPPRRHVARTNPGATRRLLRLPRPTRRRHLTKPALLLSPPPQRARAAQIWPAGPAPAPPQARAPPPPLAAGPRPSPPPDAAAAPSRACRNFAGAAAASRRRPPAPPQLRDLAGLLLSTPP